MSEGKQVKARHAERIRGKIERREQEDYSLKAGRKAKQFLFQVYPSGPVIKALKDAVESGEVSTPGTETWREYGIHLCTIFLEAWSAGAAQQTVDLPPDFDDADRASVRVAMRQAGVAETEKILRCRAVAHLVEFGTDVLQAALEEAKSREGVPVDAEDDPEALALLLGEDEAEEPDR